MGIIHVGRTKGRWRRPIALVAASAVIAGLAAYLNHDHPVVKEEVTFASSAPSALSTGDETKPAASTTTRVAAPPPQAPPAKLIPQEKAQQYAALTVPGATPEMLSQAYVFAKHCIVERRSYAFGLETTGQGTITHPQSAVKCALGPGDPENATWKRILQARVQLNAFGAITDVLDARWKAYADDPEGWKRLYKQAYENGLNGAEPVVIGGESDRAYQEGDYRKAAVYAVAHAIGFAQEAGVENVDLGKDRLFAQAIDKVAPDQRQLIVIEGHELARKWRKAP
jgi:hypothetical protein